MRTLTTPVSTEVGQVITRPGYLVQIAFPSPLLMSSRSTLAWAGNTWTTRDLKIQGLGVDGGTSAQSGRLTLGDTDKAISTLLLAYGIADRRIDVWALYGDAPATTDPVYLFAGVGRAWTIDPARGECGITMGLLGTQTSRAPGVRITRENGFNYLPARGSVYVWNGETYRFE